MEVYKDRFLSAMLGVMIFIVFQPFRFPDDWKRYPFILAFVLLSIACVMLSEFIVTKILRMPNDLTRGIKYLARRNFFFVPINIIILTFSITTLFYYFEADPSVDYYSFESLSYLVVCLICISVFQSLYWKNRYNAQILTHELCESQRINGILQERERQREKAIVTNEETIEYKCEPREEINITGSTKESLKLCLEDLLYVESSGNYITVHYLKEEKVSRIDIRTCIKDVCDLLAPYPSIMRCHRAFIVNLSNVVSLERRSSGMELKIRNFEQRIPVSKSYIQELKQRLQDPE